MSCCKQEVCYVKKRCCCKVEKKVCVIDPCCNPCQPLVICPPKHSIYGEFIGNSLVGVTNQADLKQAVVGPSGSTLNFSASGGTINIPFAGRYKVTFEADVQPVEDPTSLVAYLDTGGLTPAVFTISQRVFTQGANVTSVTRTVIIEYSAPGMLRLMFTQPVVPITTAGNLTLPAPFNLVIQRLKTSVC